MSGNGIKGGRSPFILTLDGMERHTLFPQGSKEGLLPLPHGECPRSELRSSVLRLAGVWGGKPHAFLLAPDTRLFFVFRYLASIGKCAPTRSAHWGTFPACQGVSLIPLSGFHPNTPQGTSPLTRYHSPWGRGSKPLSCPLSGVVSFRVTSSRVEMNGLRPPLTTFPLPKAQKYPYKLVKGSQGHFKGFIGVLFKP